MTLAKVRMAISAAVKLHYPDMRRPPSSQLEIPAIWKFATMVVAVALAKFVVRGVIPANAHNLLHLFGGALVAGVIGAILFWSVLMPLARRRGRKPNE